MPKPATVDAYIATALPEAQAYLRQMRAIVKAAAPEAEEAIGYSMPAIKAGKFLVYYAGYRRHIGFYPTGAGMAAFADEFKGYVHSKGAVQLPLDKPLPADLITKVVHERLRQVGISPSTQ